MITVCLDDGTEWVGVCGNGWRRLAVGPQARSQTMTDKEMELRLIEKNRSLEAHDNANHGRP